MDKVVRTSFKQGIMYVLWLLLSLLHIAPSDAKLFGDHICQKEIIVPKEVPKWELRNKTTRSYKWCMNVPPRCSVYSNRLVNESRTTIINVTMAVETCCDGFEEQNHSCVTRCPKCQHGLCLKGTCVCQIGWNGPECDTPFDQTTEVASTASTTAPSTLPTTTPTTIVTTGFTPTAHRSLVDLLDLKKPQLQSTSEDPHFSNEDLEGSGLKSPYLPLMVTQSTPGTIQTEIEDLPLFHSIESEETLEYREMSNTFEDPIAEEDASAADYRDIFEDNAVKSVQPKDNYEYDRALNPMQSTTTHKSVLSKPTNAVQDYNSKEQEMSLKGNLLKNSAGDFHDGKYERRSSHENFGENATTVDKAADKNLIYSICAASLTTFFILVVVVTLYAIKNSRKKMAKTKEGSNVASVAIYRSSIFHSPLPDPPMFDNPTYLTAKPTDDNWNADDHKNSFEAKEFTIAFQKPFRNVKLASKPYLYDHPPSTGSYRASSDVDALSQYNFTQKSFSTSAITEPLYAEIPSKEDMYVNTKSENIEGSNSQNNDSGRLYMNTSAHTKF